MLLPFKAMLFGGPQNMFGLQELNRQDTLLAPRSDEVALEAQPKQQQLFKLHSFDLISFSNSFNMF